MKLFIAQTLDGYIAGEGGSLDHLIPFQGDDYGYDAHIADVRTVVMGRAALDTVLPLHGWPYPAHVRGIVMTSRPLPAGVPDTVVSATDPATVARQDPDAYLDGGGATIRAFLDLDLITEARIFTFPLLLGAGIRLFPNGATLARRWTLLDVQAFPCGAVLHHYDCRPAE